MALKQGKGHHVLAILNATKPLLCPSLLRSSHPFSAVPSAADRRASQPYRQRRLLTTQASEDHSHSLLNSTTSQTPSGSVVTHQSEAACDAATETSAPPLQTAEEQRSPKREKKKWNLQDRIARERTRLESLDLAEGEVDLALEKWKTEYVGRTRAIRQTRAKAVKKPQHVISKPDKNLEEMSEAERKVEVKRRLRVLVEEAGRRVGLVGKDEESKLENISEELKSHRKAESTETPSSEPTSTSPPSTSPPSTSPPSNKTTASHSSRPPSSPEFQPKEPWQIQKQTLKSKFPDGWAPRRRLSPDTILGIQHLHNLSPQTYTTPYLAQQFSVSPESIRRILKSQWKPSEEELQRKRERWARRYDRIWDIKSAIGQRPMRARDKELEDPNQWEMDMEARKRLEEARREEPLYR